MSDEFGDPMRPGRWWRVVHAGVGGKQLWPAKVWCETSDEDEAREALKTCPGGGVLQRIYERTEVDWRDV